MASLILIFVGWFNLFIIKNILRNKDFLNNYVRTSPKAFLWRKFFGEEKSVFIIRKIFVPMGFILSVGFILVGVFVFTRSIKNINNEPKNDVYMNDFADIGFGQSDKFDVDVFMRLIELAADKGEWIETPKGFYIKLADKSGAEIWGQADKQKKLIGGHPYFEGKSRNKFKFEPFFGSKYSDLDGSISSYIQVDETEQEYPLVFDVPNFYLNNKFNKDEIITVQITAFPKPGFEIYKNYLEYSENNKDNNLAEEALIPIGTFSFDGSEKELDAKALFTGTIKEAKELTNSITGKKFFHLYVKTLSAYFDVVIPSDVLQKKPEAGEFISGVFWMTGKII